MFVAGRVKLLAGAASDLLVLIFNNRVERALIPAGNRPDNSVFTITDVAFFKYTKSSRNT